MSWSASTSYATKALTVASNGVGTFNGTSGSTPFYPNSTETISYLDKEAGKVLLTEDYNYEDEDWYGNVTTKSGTRYFWGIIDPETGIIVRCYSSATSVDALSDTFGFTFYVMIPETIVSANVKGGRFEEASDSTDHVVFSYTFADASVCTIYLTDTNAYFGASVESEDGTAIEDINNIDTAETIYVYDSEDNLIVCFANNGSDKFVALDGYQGTYTNALGNVVADGHGGFVLGGTHVGTYTLAVDAEYTADAYIAEGEYAGYYEITLDKVNGTYTLNKPMVTVSYNVGEVTPIEGAPADVNVNKNFAYTLPVLTNENHVFRGWFADAECTEAIGETYAPSATGTIYAKWDVILTLTVVYGNGIDNAVLYYGAGDTTAPVAPAFTNGKLFDHWYTSDDEGVTETAVYTPGAITENTVIYCAWILPVETMGSYKGFEIWGSTSAYANKTLEISATGVVTGTQSGTITDYDAETGKFVLVSGSSKRNGHYDVATGTIAINYGTSTAGLGDDTYVYFKDATTVAIDKANSANWNNKYTRVATATVDSVDRVVFIYDGKVYGNVTVTALDGEDNAITDYASYATAASLTVANATDASVIANFKHDGADLVCLDGFEGTYVPSEGEATDVGTIVVDGVGTITAGENTYAYTVVNGSLVTVINNQTRVFFVLDGEYMFDQDGVQGEYDSVDGEDVYIFDGYGNWEALLAETSGTYVVNGATITLYETGAEEGVTYGLGEGALLGQTIFAGLTFTGT